MRQANIDDLQNIKITADKHKKELGFVIRGALVKAIERGELLYHDGAFCHYHKRRDGWTTIYEICVPPQFRGQGIGRAMVESLGDLVQAKCPVDLPSNGFYQKLGFISTVVKGKKRDLNLWRLMINQN